MSLGTGPYLAMSHSTLVAGNLLFRAVEPRDIERIRLWRNAQTEVLRQTVPISSSEQVRYFAEYVWPEKERTEPSQILLAIEHEGQMIGYSGLVHISWPNRRAELSFLLAPELEIQPKELSVAFVSTIAILKQIAFEDLGLHRITSETFCHRNVHIAVLESSGFQREGILRDHVVINGEFRDSLIHGCLVAHKPEQYEVEATLLKPS